MARLPYPDIEHPDIKPMADRVRRERGGKVGNVFRMLMHSPTGMNGWMDFFTAVRQRYELDPRSRELGILKVAVINGADYEFNAHAPVAMEAGVTQAEIDVLRTDKVPDSLTARDKAVLAYTEAMTRHIKVPDDVFAAVRSHFNERLLVELTLTIGGYNLVSRFLVAMEIDHDAIASPPGKQ